MPKSRRPLCLIGLFEPYGLKVETGNSGTQKASASENGCDNNEEKKTGREALQKRYCLFDADSTRERGGSLEQVAMGTSCWDHDEELYIHGNTVVWSAGHQVRKRFSASSAMLQAKWCRLNGMREPLLCVLHSDSLTTYTPSGEMNAVPLQYSVASIWSLPCGLLLQKAVDSTPLTSSDTTQAMESPLAYRDWHREGFREYPYGAAGSLISPGAHNSSGNSAARRSSLFSPAPVTPVSSLFTLHHPLEEPQAVQVEEGGKLRLLADMEEEIVWTSSSAPYVVTYHTGKRQHSVWLVKSAPQDLDANVLAQTGPSLTLGHPMETSGSICLQRVWSKKGGQQQANQVFLASDEDGVTVLCLVVAESQQLFSFRLHTREISDDLSNKPKLEVAWTIAAISAAPVVATRPRLKNKGTPFYDILTLSPDGTLSLHTGRHHVCHYYLPRLAVQSLYPPAMQDGSNQPRASSARYSASTRLDEAERVVGLQDAVQGRVNVVTASGKMYRCAVGFTPLSAITILCMNALAQGLRPALYRYLLSRLLEREFLMSEALHVATAKSDGKPDLEWAAFCGLITEIIRDMPGEVRIPKKSSVNKRSKESLSSWDFLLQSSMHQSNLANLRYPGLPLPQTVGTVETLPVPGPSVADNIDAETAVYFSVMIEILEVLHAVYEDCKLDTLRWRELWQLAAALSSLAAAAGELDYVDHYSRDFPMAVPSMPELTESTSLRNEGRAPPNLFQWLENLLRGKGSIVNSEHLPSLLTKEYTSCVDWSRKVIGFYEILTGGQSLNGQLPSGVHMRIATGTGTSSEQRTVLAMVAEGFGLPDIDRLPPGVSLPLRHALDRCREAPPGDWPAHAYVLVGREDLASMHVPKNSRTKMAKVGRLSTVDKSESLIKHTDDVWMAAPYMLHLRPVPILPASSDSNELRDPDVQAAGSEDSQLIDGMEHVFSTSAPLRFGRDLRLNEVRCLLGSSKPAAVRTANSPDVSDPDIVAQQQAQLWQLAQRTTALPFGRGAFTLATSRPMLTEALPIPKLVLAGRLPSQHDATVNLDANTGNLADVTSWPEFHNGVAAGLRLAPGQAKITRTWIVYNKPDEPNFSHAGLLMALGLHKHLGVLAATDVYRYLSQEHEATTVGVLLGMAAAHRGTMDPGISKMLYLHIPARHPPSFPELELPTLMQSAALMAVGLLYQGSAHRLTTEILLAEIGRRPGGDNALDREGYSLAAGLALGLVTLGRGRDAWGLADLHIEDRLRHYMSGGSDPTDDRQRRFDGTISGNSISSASRSLEDQSQAGGQVMEGSVVNLDVTAPGATLALALMFLKTNCGSVADRLAIPDTHFALEYVRPDFILLRLVARSLILWDSVQATEDWIQAQIPGIVKEALVVYPKEGGSLEMPLNADADMEALAQAHVNILAGACLSIGLRFAGSASTEAEQLLRHYALYFLNESRKGFITFIPQIDKLDKYMKKGGPKVDLRPNSLSVPEFEGLPQLNLIEDKSFWDDNGREEVVAATTPKTSLKRAAVPHSGAANPNNWRQYVDRGTLETCLDVAVLSLSLVMAGTGHLETFRLLRFLRRRTDSDGAITFGNQMAISMAIGFLFLGGGGLTFATNNGAIAALLMALYPRFPTAPNDQRCHLQAFRHLYVLATEARCLQTVDVDTGLPVYAPIEITLKESAFYCETTYSRVTPCILPERFSLKRVRVCGPRYWPQEIELPATDQPWWEPGGTEGGPFDGGILYVKRKVGARSYADDPIGCRSLLSRALHKNGDDTNVETSGSGQHSKVDQLVSTFSADPSMLAFAQLFCGRARSSKSGGEFDEFCLLALFESVSTDRPALLQTYLALYTAVEALLDRATGLGTSVSSICSDSLSIYSLKIAVAYCDVLGQNGEGGPLVQRTFLAALAKRVDDVLSCPQVITSGTQSPKCKPYSSELFFYLDTRQFPSAISRQGDTTKGSYAQDTRVQRVLFACFLCWYGIPRPRLVTTALQQLTQELPGFQSITLSDLHSALPLLALVLPGTPMPALLHINECLPFLSLSKLK